MDSENEDKAILEIKRDITMLMRRIGTLEKEMSVMATRINMLRDVIRKIIKDIPSMKDSKYVDKGGEEVENKKERVWFELWGDMSDTEDFGD